MILIRIHGGLGNQLFEYAFGHGLAKRMKTELVLDTSSYATLNGQRVFSLNAFAINARVATPSDVRTLGIPPFNTSLFSRLQWKLFHLRERRLPKERRTYVREPHYQYAPSLVSELHNNIYLDGYWQSEKYFTDVASDIRKAIKPITLSEDANHIASELATLRAEGRAVSVHVRRGDYVTNKGASEFNGTLTPDYYQESVRALAARGIENPFYYIFSDDIEWAHAHLPFLTPAVFVSRPGLIDVEELHLMSMCSHHIIANSTFSWWGAWLNPNAKKVVVAPKRWFKDASVDTRDVLPSAWIQV